MLRHKSDPGFTQLMCTDAEHATDDDGSRNKRRGTELRLVLVMATNVGASDESHDVFLSSLPAEYQQVVGSSRFRILGCRIVHVRGLMGSGVSTIQLRERT